MEADGENPEIELDLGLSTNGRFGVDPTRAGKLTRSSSTANPPLALAAGEAEPHAPPLWRTRSLPTWAEEESRRRKELQAISRMEARKKRMGKLRSSRVKENGSRGKKGSHEGSNGNFTFRKVADVSTPRRFENGDLMESSQGSIGPPIAGSSSQIEGLKLKQTAEISPPSHENEPSNQVGDAKVATINSPKNPNHEMPLVTTKDTGPNSHKVEGFLYGYKRGEDVRIVCVCHGTFLTPKEFVEHGGGGNVEHPLKHIVVNPFPLS